MSPDLQSQMQLCVQVCVSAPIGVLDLDTEVIFGT